VASMSYNEVRAKLKARKLSSKGKKAVLVARLQKAIRAEQEAKAAEDNHEKSTTKEGTTTATPDKVRNVNTVASEDTKEEAVDSLSRSKARKMEIESIVQTYPQRRADPAQVRKQTEGRPVSGRNWKLKQQTRASAAGTKKDNSAWKVQQKRKRQKAAMKAKENEIIEERKRRKMAKRLRIEANKKRKAENEMRSTTVQVITRADKMKKMSKKQLRQIRKQSVRADGTVELVPVYKR